MSSCYAECHAHVAPRHGPGTVSKRGAVVSPVGPICQQLSKPVKKQAKMGIEPGSNGSASLHFPLCQALLHETWIFLFLLYVCQAFLYKTWILVFYFSKTSSPRESNSRLVAIGGYGLPLHQMLRCDNVR